MDVLKKALDCTEELLSGTEAAAMATETFSTKAPMVAYTTFRDGMAVLCGRFIEMYQHKCAEAVDAQTKVVSALLPDEAACFENN